MLVAKTLINAAAGHKMMSFMDGNAGYNQIFMAPEDMNKTAFRVPGAVGLFEYSVMTFGLKNAGATYQKAIQNCLGDQIGRNAEVYVDDVVIKSKHSDTLIADLDETFKRLREWRWKLNPTKCVFGVPLGQFLGFLFSQRGIEASTK